VALLAVTVGGEGGGADGVAGTAGHVGGFGNAVIGLFVVDVSAGLRKDFGVAGLALILYALVVLAVGEGDVAVLRQKQDGFRRDACG
jgi:hypothetical protein